KLQILNKIEIQILEIQILDIV
ncbi:MAG: hypothetical protein H6Q54_2026, partial [Deltaproteobacteria bacterium]|nr:hypothetical protein [Deltaproteobacteria bacterium]